MYTYIIASFCQAEIETEQLKQLMAAKDGQLAQLQSQVTILSRASPQPSAAEAKGIIEHLKAQIQVCTEDFEKERQDRQMALKKMASLQEQNARLQKLVSSLTTVLSLVSVLSKKTPNPKQH